MANLQIKNFLPGRHENDGLCLFGHASMVKQVYGETQQEF